MAQRKPAGTPALVALAEAGVTHSVHAYHHDPATSSFGLEAAAALGVDPARVYKTLLAEVDDRPVVAVVPVTGSLDLKALARACGGKRARMMPVAAAERQRNASPTVIDASAADHDSIFVSAGRRGMDVELSPSDLARLTGARTASIASGEG